MQKLIKKQNVRFKNAVYGIIYAVKADTNFRFQLFSLIFFVVFGYTMSKLSPLSETELLFLVLSYFLIIITELQNTSFETALNKLHPELHEKIGKSKDMNAGAVLIAGVFALFVVAFIFIRHVF